MARTGEMSRETATMTSRDLRKRGGRGPAALTLGLWRAKRMWRLLLALAGGMAAAVMLVCLVPLVMEATTVAGLRSAFARNSGSNVVYSRSLNTDSVDQRLVTKTHDQLIKYLRTQYAGIPYHLSSVYTGTIPLVVTTAQSSTATSGMTLIALAPGDMTTLYDLASGRFPRSSDSQLEAVISPLTASKLHLKLGDTVTVPVLSGNTSSPLTLRIVGFAHRVTTTTDQPSLEPYVDKAPQGAQQSFLQFAAVVSLPAVEASSTQWSALQMFAPYGGPPPQKVTGNGPPIWSTSQSATLDFSHMDWQTANRLLSNPFQGGNQAVYGGPIGPYGAMLGGPSDASVSVSGELAYTVHLFQERLIGAQVAIYILLADLLGLVLLFLGLMLSALVERQEALIALLRSRGASRGQIMRTLSLQSGLIGVLAILVGPLLAVPLARWLAERLLGAQTPGIGDALGGNPVQAALGTWVVALIAGLLFTGVLVWSSRRAAKRTLVALRTDEARGTRRPLWQRLYLDVVAAVLAIAGYTVYIIATRAAATTNTFQGNTVQTALSPLALVAPILLMVAAALLFVRILPWLLRLAERIAARSKGAPAVLAFSQLARSSAQARRTILLLALVLSFGIFTLAATATLGRYISESADYAVGADFSGGIVHTSGSGVEALQTEAAPFASIPGVTSVSVAYRDSLTVLEPGQQPTDFSAPQAYPLLAVDPATYAKTVIWPSQDTQSVTSALALLAAHATDATSRDTVPVVLDRSAAQTLGVHAGSTLTLIPNGYGSNRMHFEVAGVVNYLPAVFHDQPSLGGGILADYHSFYAVYEHDMGSDNASAIVPNFVLMNTRSDAATLERVRKAIGQGETQLTETVGQSAFGPITMSAIDRRTFLASVRSDPFYVALTSTITTGAAIALLLALVGVITGAWLGVARRRQGLAILRALGLPSRQVRRVVIWEQGFILALAVGLGIGLGAFLSAVMLKSLPLLVLSSSIGGPIEAGGMPPVTVWPWPLLAGALAAVIVICALVVVIAARVAARPAAESALRLASE